MAALERPRRSATSSTDPAPGRARSRNRRSPSTRPIPTSASVRTVRPGTDRVASRGPRRVPRPRDPQHGHEPVRGPTPAVVSDHGPAAEHRQAHSIPSSACAPARRCRPASSPLRSSLSRLDGVVVDAANHPVAGAVVTVSYSTRGTIRRVTADGDRALPHRRSPAGPLSPGRGWRRCDDIAGAAHDRLWSSVQRDPARAPRLSRRRGRRERSAGGVDCDPHLPRRRIDRPDARPCRLARLQDVVATLPGWATEDNGLLHSRGVDDGFLYVVDGVPVYERLDQTSGARAERIDVERTHRGDRLRAARVRLQSRRRDRRAHRASDRRAGAASRRSAAEATPRRSAAAIRPAADRARRLAWAAGGGERSVALPRSGASRQPPQRRRQAAPRPGRSIGRHRRLAIVSRRAGLRRRALRRAEQRGAGGGRAGSAAAVGAGRRHGVVAARLVEHDGVAARRLRPSHRVAPRSQRPRHAADCARRIARLTRIGALAGCHAAAPARHVVKAGVESQPLRLDESFGFAVTDDDAAAEAGLSEAALAFDADIPFRFERAGAPWLCSVYVQDTWQATLGADRCRRRALRSHAPAAAAAAVEPASRAWRSRLAADDGARLAEPLLPATAAGEPAARVVAGGAGALAVPRRRTRPSSAAPTSSRSGNGRSKPASSIGRPRRGASTWPSGGGTSRVRRSERVRRDHNHLPQRRRRRAARTASTRGWSSRPARGVVRLRQRQHRQGHADRARSPAACSSSTTSPTSGPASSSCPITISASSPSAGLTWTGAAWRHAVGHRPATRAAHQSSSTTTPRPTELAARPGANRVDFESGRVEPRTVISLSRQRADAGGCPGAVCSLRASVLNLFDASYAYNFGNPFSGTHFGAPRTASVTLRLETR